MNRPESEYVDALFAQLQKGKLIDAYQFLYSLEIGELLSTLRNSGFSVPSDSEIKKSIVHRCTADINSFVRTVNKQIRKQAADNQEAHSNG